MLNWKTKDAEKINQLANNGLMKALNIKVTEISDECLKGEMTVTSLHHQQYGVLHGGASCVFAETLGSIASNITLENGKKAVGTQIMMNHLRPFKQGVLAGLARPIHVGKSRQIWEIEIFNQENKLISQGQLTTQIIDF